MSSQIELEIEQRLPVDLVHNDQYHNNVLHHLINAIAVQFEQYASQINYMQVRLDDAEEKLREAEPLIKRAKALDLHKLED